MKRFRVLVTTTLVGTFLLILLGGYVKAIGAGLACPDWPACFADEPGLAAWVPDLTHPLVFAEWLHRLVASIVGFLILGSVVEAWRNHREETGIRWSATLALALLPVQVVMGGITVTSLLEPVTVVAHLGLATLIFGSLVVATVLAWVRDPSSPLRLVPRSGTIDQT